MTKSASDKSQSSARGGSTRRQRPARAPQDEILRAAIPQEEAAGGATTQDQALGGDAPQSASPSPDETPGGATPQDGVLGAGGTSILIVLGRYIFGDRLPADAIAPLAPFLSFALIFLVVVVKQFLIRLVHDREIRKILNDKDVSDAIKNRLKRKRSNINSSESEHCGEGLWCLRNILCLLPPASPDLDPIDKFSAVLVGLHNAGPSWL
jgi:hypothetical protein